MKRKHLLTFVFALFLIGCNNNTVETKNYETVNVQVEQKDGQLSDFSLLGPANLQKVVGDLPTFSWEESTNASSYTLEICSNSEFSIEAPTYIKKVGIVATNYTLDTYLKNKETTYYWRVSAINKSDTKICNEKYRSFYLGSPDFGEIEFNIDYADEWVIHKDGSKADISVDKSNFFNNGKNSLAISFNDTYTKQGIPNSDGWIVVSHQQETEMYGVDAFYFNFYYNGQDANIYLRVIDEDNEYYNAQIKLARDAKQTIIMKFDEFTLRTKGGTTIANQKFDYNYIKGVELVFEQSFGDGICLISDLKAVHYDDYQYMFIDKVNFNDFDKDSYILDNYNGFVGTPSEDGNSFTISYGGDIKGYGFLKIPVNRTLVTGDAFKVKISHTGETSHRILFRVIEEDGDRWVYKQKCSTLVDGEIIIPFNAFTISEANGDGARQFYYIKQFQFGIENCYSSGTMTYENFSVCTLADEKEGLYMNSISDDGLIANFDNYTTSVEMYYDWQNTIINKNEEMSIDNQYTPTGVGYSGKFCYKSDMYAACYGLQFENGVEGFNSIKFDCLDMSILKNPTTGSANPFAHLVNGAPKMIVTIYVSKGETYSYVIDKLEQSWTRYEINFEDFTLDDGYSIYNATPLESENIRGIMFALQFYYTLEDGTASPQYTSSNPVYLDNIYLSNSEATSKKDVIEKIKPLESDANYTVVDDYNNYTTEDITSHYSMADYDYSALTIIDLGNNDKCLDMQYKGNSTSVSYGRFFNLDETAAGKAIQVDLKGDDKATVYINVFFDYAGVTYKYRATISNVASTWKTYTIGFSKFVKVEGTGDVTISAKTFNSITKITIGIVNFNDNELSHVYMDNLMFNNKVKYSANTVVDKEGSN